VAVIDVATGTQVGTTMLGYPTGSPALNADGTRVVIVTGVFDMATQTTTTRVAVIDTATGTQTGSANLTGAPKGSAVLSVDGTRALVTTFVTDPKTGYTSSTQMTVLRVT